MHVIYLVDTTIEREKAFKSLSKYFEDVGGAFALKVPVEDGKVDWGAFGRKSTSLKRLIQRHLRGFTHYWGDERGLEELFKYMTASLP